LSDPLNLLYFLAEKNMKDWFDSFTTRYVPGSVICLWIGALFVWLGRYPNQFTAQIFDRWILILSFISIAGIAFGLCRKFQWRAVRILLIILCVLFSIAILNFSMWMPISVQNNTSVSLTAVMMDLSSSNKIRVVSIPPQKTKWVELIESEDGTFGKKQWSLLVYDSSAKIYYQDIIEGSKIKRGHIIEIEEQSSYSLMADEITSDENEDLHL